MFYAELLLNYPAGGDTSDMNSWLENFVDNEQVKSTENFVLSDTALWILHCCVVTW